MQKLIECVPNFSEGRDMRTIAEIVKAILSVEGVKLLGQTSDSAHHRSVITFAGEPDAVVEAAFRSVKCASELIDLDVHKGEHPRMGATDVMPLVPIKGVSIEECVEYARKLGARIGRELEIPVYLYEKAATCPERENLANVRAGEYEGIMKEIETHPQREPDFGPRKMGKAGAVAVGVRDFLIAYNVNLKTGDVKVAKAIAQKIRFSSGGMAFVKALGFRLTHDIVQVSMNLTNFRVTSVKQVFEAIAKECKKHGVEILESEVIGLIPKEATFPGYKEFLKLGPDFTEDQVLEVALEKAAC